MIDELMVELYGNMIRKAEKGMNEGIKCHGPAYRQLNDKTRTSCMINDRIYMYCISISSSQISEGCIDSM